MANKKISLKGIAEIIEKVDVFVFGPDGCPIYENHDMTLQDEILTVGSRAGRIEAKCKGVVNNEVCDHCRFRVR